MAKRGATSELTRDNWDKEDEQEEPGEFLSASSEQISQRKIRVAKRRLGGQDGNKSSTSSVFGSFSGFGSSAPSANLSSPFNTSSISFPAPTFGVSAPSSLPLSGNKAGTSSTGASNNLLSSPMTSKLPEFGGRPTNQPMVEPIATNEQHQASSTFQPPSEFCADVKALNESVIAWLQENLQENPYVSFAPVFDDYKKHFHQLEEKHKWKVSSNSKGELSGRVDAGKSGMSANGSFGAGAFSGFGTTPATQSNAPSIATTAYPFASTVSNSTAPSFSTGFGKPSTTPFSTGVTSANVTKSSSSPSFGISATTMGKPFTFGQGSTNTTTAAPVSTGNVAMPSLVFGSGNSTATSTFTFGGFKPPENQAASSGKDTEDGDEDGEYAPPEPERVEQVEEDAFYNIRCKLFYKKDGKFVEKGVGTLFLKPMDESNKTQLLVRADTALGNILLNVALNDSIPCSRTGKNNVTIVCVPNPPLDPKSQSQEPAVLLLRVKTTEEADKLLEEISKAKGSA